MQSQMQALRSLKQLRHGCAAASAKAFSQKPYTTATEVQTAAAVPAAPACNTTEAGSSTSTRRQGWLAGLAVGAATACVVGSNMERAPITRRPQLLFSMYKSPPTSGEGAAMPEAYGFLDIVTSRGGESLWDDWDESEEKPHQPDYQLLRAAYHKIAEGVANVAASDLILQKCLATIPNKIELQLYPGNFQLGSRLGVETYRLDKHGFLITPLLGLPFINKAGAIGLKIPSSYFLHRQTAEEAMTGIAKELAHVLANHMAESKSCKLLLNTLLGAAIAAYYAGYIGFWALVLTLGVRNVGKFWVVDTTLHRQQVYEADAIAAAICTASGADPSSVVSSMQRAYIADASSPTNLALQHTRKQRMQWYIAKLQSLLPDSQIPQNEINGSSGLQLLIDATATGVTSASPQLIADYNQSFAMLKDCLADELCDLRSPYGGWADINPHWLDRIACIENMLKSDAFLDTRSKHIDGSMPNFSTPNR